MGVITEVSERVPIYSASLINNGDNFPKEYPDPCPFLTPENLGYPRPTPYVYIQS